MLRLGIKTHYRLKLLIVDEVQKNVHCISLETQ